MCMIQSLHAPMQFSQLTKRAYRNLGVGGLPTHFKDLHRTTEHVELFALTDLDMLAGATLDVDSWLTARATSADSQT